MGILNRPSDGQPSALIYLRKALLGGPLDSKTLIDRCAPESIDTKPMKDTFRTWTGLGLFDNNDEGLVTLSSEFDADPLSPDPALRALRAAVRSLVLAEENNKDFGKKEPKGTADFTFLLAWLLSADVYGGLLASRREAENFERRQLHPIEPNKYAFQNDTRWSGFLDWAFFCEFGFSQGGGILLNPSRVVKAALPLVFDGSDELPIDTFIDNLSLHVPVLERGKYAVQARERATKDWSRLPEGGVSPALSLALKTLKQEGAIGLDRRDDASLMHLLGRQFARIGEDEYSHILLKRED